MLGFRPRYLVGQIHPSAVVCLAGWSSASHVYPASSGSHEGFSHLWKAGRGSLSTKQLICHMCFPEGLPASVHVGHFELGLALLVRIWKAHLAVWHSPGAEAV